MMLPAPGALLSSHPMQLLSDLTALSHWFGTPDFVIGGGGNTSCKDTGTLWVKPSGTALATIAAEQFVALDRRQLARLYTHPMPADVHAREAEVLRLMMQARLPGQTGRPSVEAPLHDLLPGTFVVHTHCTLVNGLTCARRGAEAAVQLFPDALWVPYVDPGFTLCMEVRRHLNGHRLVLLQNHGIFVAGNTPDEIRDTYRRVLDTLRAEYARAGIPSQLQSAPPAAPEPVTPDHIVYGKNPKLAPAMAADCALIRQLAEAFGGMQLLTERAQQFIRDWEVEAYRQRQMT